MKAATITRVLILAVAAVGLGTAPVLADPLPGQILKFQQLPMVGTSIDGVKYNGHDELSTLIGTPDAASGVVTTYNGIAMADDFADRFDTPVVHLRWWGSYLDNVINPDLPVNKFLVAFESDVPVTVGGSNFSHPGTVLSSQIVTRDADGTLKPGEGTFLEHPITTGLPEDIFEYNAELHLGKEFPQKPDTVYWLKIAALVDLPPNVTTPPPQWGWHNRDYTIMDPLAGVPPVGPGEIDQQPIVDPGFPSKVWHFQDDAVSADTSIFLDPAFPLNGPLVDQTNYQPQFYVDDLDGPGPLFGPNGLIHRGIGQFSKDLAFELYTVPEPSTLILAALGLATLFGFSRRRNRTS